MKSFWRRDDDLERELRAQRPAPRPEFLSALESRIHGDRYRRPARSLRLGLAGALTAGMLVALAGFGGLSYAASGVTHAVAAAVHVVEPVHHATPSGKLTSAMVQYKVQMCFKGHTVSVDSHAVGTLQANGATVGACSGGAFKPATKLVRLCFKAHNTQVAKKDVAALLKAGFTKGFCKV